MEAWIDNVSIGAVVPTSIGNATGFHLNETAGVGFADVKYGPCNVWTRFVEPWQVATMYATRISTFAYNSLQIKWDFNEGAAGTTIANSQVVNIHDPTYNSLSQGANTPEYGDNEMAIKYRRRVA